MVVQALGAFERNSQGDWVCQKDVIIDGPMGSVNVKRGQYFHRHTVFAGYDDFTIYLDSVGVESWDLAAKRN